MKVKEFVDRYTKNQRVDIAKVLEVNQYTGIALKREMAKLVLDNCTAVVDGKIHIDSVERYILFTIAVIGMHTNLEFNNEEDEEYSVIDDYDLLCESGALVKIIDTFKDDYMACQEILNMMTSDRMQYDITIDQRIGQFLDGIQNIVGSATGGLIDKLNIDDLVNRLPADQNKLVDLYNLINNK